MNSHLDLIAWDRVPKSYFGSQDTKFFVNLAPPAQPQTVCEVPVQQHDLTSHPRGPWCRQGSNGSIISPTNRNSFASFLKNNTNAFISFSSSVVLTRTSTTILNRNSESGHPFFVPVLGRTALSVSSSRMMLTVGFSEMPFIRLGKFPSIPS